jgi:hypothetical protein
MGSAPPAAKSPALGRAPKPFTVTEAAHAVVRAAEQLGWDVSDPDKFLRKVQHVEYGLSAEMEFATILRWLGWCTFVHRLNDDLLQDPARSRWSVPDLFAAFDVGGEACSRPDRGQDQREPESPIQALLP